jgi:hypothetical protein
VDQNLAMLVVTRALVQSYPTWTDENGTNVEQLSAIAVAALTEHGLLLDPHVDVDLTDVPLSTGVTRDRA